MDLKLSCMGNEMNICMIYTSLIVLVTFAGGDSKTLMVVQVSPVEKNLTETVCSLHFAQGVRTVELGQATRKTASVEHKKKSPQELEVKQILLFSLLA